MWGGRGRFLWDWAGRRRCAADHGDGGEELTGKRQKRTGRGNCNRGEQFEGDRLGVLATSYELGPASMRRHWYRWRKRFTRPNCVALRGERCSEGWPFVSPCAPIGDVYFIANKLINQVEDMVRWGFWLARHIGI